MNNILRRYMAWCAEPTRMYCAALRNEADLMTHIRGRMNGKRYNIKIDADHLAALRRGLTAL